MPRGTNLHEFRNASARELVIRAAHAGWLGALAREVGLEHLLGLICDNCAFVERTIWREFHRRHAVAASPLALELLASAGMSAPKAVLGLRPYGRWSTWLCGHGAAAIDRRLKSSGPTKPLIGDEMRSAFLYGGRVLRGWTHHEGALGVRISAHGLDVAARLGPVLLRTEGSRAIISSGTVVLLTVLAAMAGRSIGALFDHPALRDRDYPVEGQVEQHPGHRWALAFHTGLEPWRTPWRVGKGSGPPDNVDPGRETDRDRH